MARSKVSPSIPPSITPAQAVVRLKRQIERIEDIINFSYDMPEVAAWNSTTLAVLNDAFGQPNGNMHPTTDAIAHARGGQMFVNMPESALQEYHVNKHEKRKALLIAAIEQLEDRAEAAGLPAQDDASPAKALAKVQHLLSRFHAVASQLRHRHADRETLDVADEYDVQDLLHALLKVEFDDVREEEHAPSSAGSNPRMDFLLKREQIVIEVKKTRKGLGDRELGDELILDVGRYRSHPDCKILVCFIYDPENRVKNAAGLKTDLAKQGAPHIQVDVIVNPR